jgi:hypothetical protein
MVDEDTEWHARWTVLLDGWGHRLDEAGLGELFRALGGALRPLAPLAAQALWLTQPALGLLGYGQAAGALADLLDAPSHD